MYFNRIKENSPNGALVVFIALGQFELVFQFQRSSRINEFQLNCIYSANKFG